jgi:hypothetical protein
MSNSEMESTKFARLNDSNYVSWSLRMEAELVRKDLWGWVSGEWGMPEVIQEAAARDDGTPAVTKAHVKENTKERALAKKKWAEARAEIILRVEDSQLSHVTYTDPAEIWNQLKLVHRARGFATRISIKRKFFTARKKPNEPMSAWISRIRGIANHLNEIGAKVDNEEVILALTMGLPEHYNNLIITLDSSTQLEIDTVITRLLNEEIRQEAIPGDGSGSQGSQPREVALAATTRDRSAKSHITCFRCGRKGHYRSECPRSADERSDGKSDSGRKNKYDEAAVLAIGPDDSIEDIW